MISGSTTLLEGTSILCCESGSFFLTVRSGSDFFAQFLDISVENLDDRIHKVKNYKSKCKMISGSTTLLKTLLFCVANPDPHFFQW